MDIGDFTTLVSYQQRASGQDAAGQPNGAWVTVCKRWTHIRMPNGAEAIRADAEVSTVKASLRVLNCPRTLDASMRGVVGTTVYQIRAVLPDAARQEYVDLVCEVVP